MNNKWICVLSTGVVVATRLLPLRNIGDDFHDEESDRRVLSNAHRQLPDSGLFPSVSSTAERPVRQNVDEEKSVNEMVQRTPCSPYDSLGNVTQ